MANTELTIVALGDSITKGVRPGVEPHETFCSLIEQELGTPARPVRVINAGIGGNTTENGLQRFATDVLALHPHAVMISFGTNDAYIYEGKKSSAVPLETYEANLARMLDMLRGQRIRAVLMTPVPFVEPYELERNRTMHPYIEIMRAVTRQRDVPLVDGYAHYAELRMQGDDLESLYTDGCHPNPAGHVVLAGLCLTAQAAHHVFFEELE